MSKQAQSIDSRVLARVKKAGPGKVFTPRQFLDLGSRDAVDQALSRHTRSGAMRKLARGLYDLPQVHPQFGQVAASTDAIARALKGRDAIRLQPSGAHAANLLGLSNQVPMRVVFMTDGPTRRVKIGNREIVLKRTTPRNMATAGRTSGLVIQALRWLGKHNVDDAVVAKLRRNVPAADREQLLADVHLAPAWIGAILRQVAAKRK